MATTAYERPIVSCEDDMPQIAGVFNIACTVSSVLIMALPLQLWNIFQKQQHRLSIFTIVNNSDSTCFIIEEQSYILCLALVFVFNLLEHATGFRGPPCIESVGLVTNLWLAVLLCRLQKNPWIDWIRIVAVLISILALIIGYVSVPHEIIFFHRLSPVVNLYVVSSMGYLSYYCDGSKVAWRYYIRAVISLLVFGFSLPLEEAWCDLWKNADDNSFLVGAPARLYHSVYLHALIPYLFYNVSMCALLLSINEKVASTSKQAT